MASNDGSSSGGSLIGGIIGAVVGYFIPGVGPVKGFMYGSTIGGMLAPPTGPDQVGPRLDSLALTTSTNIAIKPRTHGTNGHRGNWCWAKNSEYIEVATTKKVRTGLFSKTKVTTYEYFLTAALFFHKGEITNVLRIWHKGGVALVYNATSDDTDTIVASGELTKYITIYKGTADQMPDPIISEDVGAASCSAFRGEAYILYNMYPLAEYQNNVGMLDPVIEYTTKETEAAELDHLVDVPADAEDTEQDRFWGLHNATNMDADGVHLWRIGQGQETEVDEPTGISLTGEIKHYVALPSGELLLKQEYDDNLLVLAPGEEKWDFWTKACKGKSDRNVFVSTRGVIKTGGAGDGGTVSHPSLLVGGPWAVSLVGFGWTPPPAYQTSTLYEAMASVLDNPGGGPGIAGTPEYMFTSGEQVAYDNVTEYGILWRDPSGFMLTRYIIYCANPDIVPPLPITSEMFYGDGSYRYMRFQVRIIDVENDTDTEYRVNVDASVEVPANQTYYVFYEDTLYFVYTYSDQYKIVKINADGSKDLGGKTHATTLSVVKIGILNDKLVVVVNNASACNLDIFDLDLAFEETKDATYVTAQFGASDAGIYNNISFDFDKVYYCRSGRMYQKPSLTGTAIDMGAHTGLILGTDSPALFNIFGVGQLIADSTNGGSMPNVGVQFFTYGAVSDPDKVLLADIITAECLLAGLTEDDIDVTTIDQLVRGYTVSERGSIRNVLSQLQACFPFDIIQSGYKLKFVKRGSTSVATVSWEELGKEVSLTQDREMETMLPRIVRLQYLDKSLNYEANQQFSERVTQSENETTLNIPIVFTPDEAAQTADILHSIYYMERINFAFTLPPTYRAQEGADIITLTMRDGTTHVVRLTSINYTSTGALPCTAKRHLPTGYVSGALGSTGPERPDTIPSISNPILGLLDIPVINDAQNQPGYTAVITHPSDGWIGGSVFRARDGVTYEMVQAFSAITVWGTCVNSLSAHGGHVIDEASTLTIKPLKGEPETVTDTQFLNEETLIAYGKPGRWEIIGFKTAVDNMDGTYTLSYLMRGKRGTEWASALHESGDYFGFINDGTAKFISALVTDIDQTLKHKAITTGRDLDSASVVNLLYGGANLTPLSPVDAFGQRDDSDNLTGYFYRRSRVTGGYSSTELLGIDAPLGEATEAYEIDVMDGADVVRTISTTSESFPYSAADQTTDFGSAQSAIDVRIYQISAAVGRGYVGAFTI